MEASHPPPSFFINMTNFPCFLPDLIALLNAPLSYAEWQALRAGGGAIAPIAEAVSGALATALASEAAVLLGGFLGGFALGEYLLKKFAPETTMPAIGQGIEGGEDGVQYKVTIRATVNPFGTVDSERVITGKFGAILYREQGPTGIVYYLTTSGGSVDVFAANREDYIVAPTVISAVRVDGNPAVLRKVPIITPGKPVRTPIAPVVPITIPGYPDIVPITPTIFPTPGVDPDKPDEETYPPGVVVQVPETGDKFTFTPTGVFWDKYKEPAVPPFFGNQPPTPPTQKKPAHDECPCPDESAGVKEIICRVKTLQKEILNDGYEYTSRSFGESSATKIDVPDGKLYRVDVFTDFYPENVKHQLYNAPATTVFYFGWFSWTADDHESTREPLWSRQQVYFAPEWAKGFEIACNTGVRSFGTFQTRAKKDYVDNCATP